MTWREKRELAAERRSILRSLQELREQMNYARIQFNETTEPEMVDACVFELNALQARYNFYLRLAREMGVAQSYADHSRILAGSLPEE